MTTQWIAYAVRFAEQRDSAGIQRFPERHRPRQQRRPRKAPSTRAARRNEVAAATD